MATNDISWHPHPEDYVRARDWARDLLSRDDWVILDTETTGVGPDAEAVQIAVVSRHGHVLLNVLLRPTEEIPREATLIHGITDEMVARALRFRDVWLPLVTVVGYAGGHVVAYNAEFEARILDQTARLHQLGDISPSFTWSCCMERYAAYVGDWSDYHGSYRYHKLPRDARRRAHDAAADCLATLDLIHLMATSQAVGSQT